MTDHPLITDEVAEAASRVFEPSTHASDDPDPLSIAGALADARRALAAAFRAIEGEKPCERCKGAKLVWPSEGVGIGRLCPDCGGKGSVPADRLALLSEVVTWMEAAEFAPPKDKYAEARQAGWADAMSALREFGERRL